jgi:hypothetical protein
MYLHRITQSNYFRPVEYLDSFGICFFGAVKSAIGRQAAMYRIAKRFLYLDIWREIEIAFFKELRNINDNDSFPS